MVVTSLVENGAGGWKMDKKLTDSEIVKDLNESEDLENILL